MKEPDNEDKDQEKRSKESKNFKIRKNRRLLNIRNNAYQIVSSARTY
jgi:hypothetical protein